jgi:hypothetical protein
MAARENWLIAKAMLMASARGCGTANSISGTTSGMTSATGIWIGGAEARIGPFNFTASTIRDTVTAIAVDTAKDIARMDIRMGCVRSAESILLNTIEPVDIAE